jgi:TatD DNase family protein
MKIIDTHSHLYSSKFSNDIDEVIARAKDVLEAIYLPNIDLDSVQPMHDLTEKDRDFFRPAMGLHPSSVKADCEEVLEKLKKNFDESGHTYYGIGETGIDLYWDKTTLDLQQQSLAIQIGWAKERSLPIILHARDAIDETINMIEKHHDASLSGVFHCFDGNIDQVNRIQQLGNFKIGIGGIVTYRKDVQKMVKEADLDLIILETDSPYLPPEPHRKDKPRRNESSYTKYVAAKIAKLKGLNYDEVALSTNKNAKTLFELEN